MEDENESFVQPGDYVVYSRNCFDSQCNGVEIGRVVSVTDTGARVCYSSGCTSALTPFDNLKVIVNPDVIAESSIGYNRFNESCPDYSKEACEVYCGGKK